MLQGISRTGMGRWFGDAAAASVSGEPGRFQSLLSAGDGRHLLAARLRLGGTVSRGGPVGESGFIRFAMCPVLGYPVTSRCCNWAACPWCYLRRVVVPLAKQLEKLKTAYPHAQLLQTAGHQVVLNAEAPHYTGETISRSFPSLVPGSLGSATIAFLSPGADPDKPFAVVTPYRLDLYPSAMLDQLTLKSPFPPGDSCPLRIPFSRLAGAVALALPFPSAMIPEHHFLQYDLICPPEGRSTVFRSITGCFRKSRKRAISANEEEIE